MSNLIERAMLYRFGVGLCRAAIVTTEYAW